MQFTNREIWWRHDVVDEYRNLPECYASCRLVYSVQNMKMEMMLRSETPVTIYKPKKRNITGNSDVQIDIGLNGVESIREPN